MFFGVGLLLIGLFLLLDKLNIISGSAWDFILPVILISLGIDFIYDHLKKKSK
ncbi:MAG: DUF5668 domain-containing protein [Candidatus Zixiibacteriota bacterium]